MTKTFAGTVFLLFALTLAHPVSAEETGTYIRATARADLSGHTEVVIHKAYAGQLGPIRDIISMQNPDPDGFPKVEIAASGAVKATRENGRIVVESTGPGLGEIDLFVTYNRLLSTIWLQMPEAPGVGTIRLNAVTEFGDGIHVARQGNNVTVRSADGQEKRLVDQSYPKSWSANAEVPAGSMILLNVAGEPDRVAPLWMTKVSLGVASLSLGLSGYLVLKLRRANPPRNPARCLARGVRFRLSAGNGGSGKCGRWPSLIRPSTFPNLLGPNWSGNLDTQS